MIKKLLLLFSLILLMSFAYFPELPTRYYYSLRKLQNGISPLKTRMIQIDHTMNNRSIISRGVVFAYKSRNAKRIHIAGNFSRWKPVLMQRNSHGVWYYYLPNFHKKITYKFLVDGFWTFDPMNPHKKDDGIGSYVSMVDPLQLHEGKQVTFRVLANKTIEFRIYKPKARLIAIVGDFNNWNPENDLLRKDRNGIWRLKKELLPGVYKYKFIIDGDWQTDLYNYQTVYDANGAIYSVIRVK